MSLITPVVQRWIEDGRRDPDAFWERAARELHWVRLWDSVFEWTPPAFRWFIGAQTNLARNALDHHVEDGRGGHTALIYLNERGERRVFTYAGLTDEVVRTAAALRALGIGKGDRLTIYMPTCCEAIVLMLAAVRIGASIRWFSRASARRRLPTASPPAGRNSWSQPRRPSARAGRYR